MSTISELRANVRRSDSSKVARPLDLVGMLLCSQLRPKRVLLRLEVLVLLKQLVMQVALSSEVIDRIDTHGRTLHVHSALVVESRSTARTSVPRSLRGLIAISSLLP